MNKEYGIKKNIGKMVEDICAIDRALPYRLDYFPSEALVPGTINVKSIVLKQLKPKGYFHISSNEPGMHFECEHRMTGILLITQERGHTFQVIFYDKNTGVGGDIGYYKRCRNKNEVEQFAVNLSVLIDIFEERYLDK